MLRLWSWNVNGLQVWDQLADAGIDLALLQEAPPPPDGWSHSVVPDPAAGWATAGWKAGRWSRRTAVVQVSETVTLAERPTTSPGELDAVAVPVSRPGTLAVADIHHAGETVTVASVYGGWERSADPRRVPYADAAAHRLLSDLSALIVGRDSHRLLVAGDLNILHRYGERGDAYWAGRYASVFDRANALGLQLVGPQAPHGRQAYPVPDELPTGSRDVPTYHTSTQGPAGATRQLDFVFASASIAEQVTVRALNDPDQWGSSDHCRIAIDLRA